MHIPVLLQEVVEVLAPAPGKIFVDATVGLGGHARELLARLDGGLLIGIDQDPEALARAEVVLGEVGGRFILKRANFADLEDVVRPLVPEGVDGILFDLGVSSLQLDEAERGFTYRADAPLDMRMDPTGAVTAADLVNTLSEDELARILREYGEEPFARRIARFLVEARARSPIATTGELVEIVKAAIPARYRRRGGHPARRTFQALRIAVNDELGRLETALEQAIRLLRPGGRLAVISFHSLEDRRVKEAFRRAVYGPETSVPHSGASHSTYRLLLRKPLTPTSEEVARNPRARSAKLRALERVT